MPNERSDAAHRRVDIFVPARLHATASGRRGWTRVDKPGEFDWTAARLGHRRGGRQGLRAARRPAPEGRRVVFKALQHYSDGQIVRWIQTGAGAERPAPVLQLGSAPAGGGGSSGVAFLVPVGIVVLLLGGGLVLRRSRR